MEALRFGTGSRLTPSSSFVLVSRAGGLAGLASGSPPPDPLKGARPTSWHFGVAFANGCNSLSYTIV